MKTKLTQSTHRKRRLGILPTLILSGIIITCYQLVRTPKLDRKVEKIAGHE